ncbi:hypothetical protein F5Y16DRAFT_416258 [Xylariaceae sp. FL0255]|nr:hypothetical protein F5Y16DRAFT_416258 [Xylariaceae sp. FL0255]
MICIFVFDAGSTVCALAPSSAVLIIRPLITGVSGGGLHIGSGRNHSVASSAGPLLGGAFTDSAQRGASFSGSTYPLVSSRSSSGGSGRDAKKGIATVRTGGLAQPGPPSRWIHHCTFGTMGKNATIPYRILRYGTVFFGAAFMSLVNVIVGSLVYSLPFEFQIKKVTLRRLTIILVNILVLDRPFEERSLDTVNNIKGVVFSPTLQPYRVSLLTKCLPAGGNITSLPPTIVPLVSVLILMNWKNNEDEQLILVSEK